MFLLPLLCKSIATTKRLNKVLRD